MQDFRKVKAWQRATALALRVDGLIRRFPRRGYGELKGQLSRSADSMGSTIAEGCGAASQREFARFLDMSIKSTSETQHHLLDACAKGLMSREECEEFVDEAVQIRRMTYGLRAKVLADLDDLPPIAPKQRRKPPRARGSAQPKSRRRGKRKKASDSDDEPTTD